jgi:hypothetical protein
MKNWKFSDAPVQTDIYWHNLANKWYWNYLKHFTSFVLTFILCCVLVTPTLFVEFLHLTAEGLLETEFFSRYL